MGYEEGLEAYRSQLLQSLSSPPSRSVSSLSDPIQVYVNERRVGELEGAGMDARLHVQSLDHIETIQLRTEEGTLLGGLVAPEFGYRTSCIQLSSDVIELCVHNIAQGGSLSAVLVPAPSFWSRMGKILGDVADKLAIRRPDTAIAYSMRTVAFTQVLLAIMVVGLMYDRMATWMNPEGGPSFSGQPVALRTVSMTGMDKLEQQLGDLARIQQKVGETLESQQKGMRSSTRRWPNCPQATNPWRPASSLWLKTRWRNVRKVFRLIDQHNALLATSYRRSSSKRRLRT
ncbi:MAG: hypothetical protein HC938_09675 [Nitrospira sp.]|nr:hypothetical protein [Nitrospira sp.]